MGDETLYLRREPLTLVASTLYKRAGWMLLGICLLHFVFWSAVTWHSWKSWTSGALWKAEDPQTLIDFELNFEFWALPGSFMVPLFLLGLLILRAGRMKDRLPNYLGWGLLLWVIACSLMLEPSGFPLGLIPGVMLIVAQRK